MAAHNLYLYLRGGRGDAFVTDLWDGLLPTEEGTVDTTTGEPDDGLGVEVSEPYRDVFTAVGASLIYHSMNSSPLSFQTSSALIFDSPAVTSPSFVGSGPGSGSYPGQVTASDLQASNSDEIAHVKPRQFAKVCTWLKFQETGADGAIFKFRKADVIGWGKHARL